MKAGVITADIIKSTDLTAIEKSKLYQKVEKCIKEINKEFPLVSEWYRGDAFQVKVKNLKDVCRVAFLLKTKIKGLERELGKTYDVRLAIGIGEIDYQQKTLAKSDGEAFHLSGRALDHLKNTKYTFIIDSNDLNKDSFNILSQFVDLVFDKHTPLQSRVIYMKLKKIKEEDIAKKLQITQSTVNQHGNAANWNLIFNYLVFFENLYKIENIEK
jgi:hypothetical protein